MIEFGCGDGNQLSLAEYPGYIGLDVSRTAIGLCQRRFAGDPAKSFFLYDGACFTDRAGIFTADLALSLDVVYHLTEDSVFETYLRHLFAAGQRLVVIYSTNAEIGGTAPHVRHRHFTPWVEANCPRLAAHRGHPGAEHRAGQGRLLRLRALVTSEAVLASATAVTGGEARLGRRTGRRGRARRPGAAARPVARARRRDRTVRADGAVRVRRRGRGLQAA